MISGITTFSGFLRRQESGTSGEQMDWAFGADRGTAWGATGHPYSGIEAGRIVELIKAAGFSRERTEVIATLFANFMPTPLDVSMHGWNVELLTTMMLDRIRISPVEARYKTNEALSDYASILVQALAPALHTQFPAHRGSYAVVVVPIAEAENPSLKEVVLHLVERSAVAGSQTKSEAWNALREAVDATFIEDGHAVTVPIVPREEEDEGLDLQALAEADAALKDDASVVHIREVPVINVKKLRERLGLTQKAFAETYGFSLGAVRHWEQNKRLPGRGERVLLNMINAEPAKVADIARETF